MNDTKKLMISIFSCTLLVLGTLALLYAVYGQYVERSCTARIDEMMTKNYAVDLSTTDSGLTVMYATPSMALTPETTPTATPTPTRRLIRIPVTLTPPPAQ